MLLYGGTTWVCMKCEGVNVRLFVLLLISVDALAIRLLYTSCITTGEFAKMRDYLARVLPHWKEESPYFPHILG